MGLAERRRYCGRLIGAADRMARRMDGRFVVDQRKLRGFIRALAKQDPRRLAHRQRDRTREDGAAVMAEKLTCQRCGKRLSRKTARLIGKEVLCSACLFPPLRKGLPVAQADRSGEAGETCSEAEGLDPEGESTVGAEGDDAPNLSTLSPHRGPHG